MENKPEVNLTGKDGNAFVILGSCAKAARLAGWSKEKIKEFQDKAMGGDYDNLLQVCSEYFDIC